MADLAFRDITQRLIEASIASDCLPSGELSKLLSEAADTIDELRAAVELQKASRTAECDAAAGPRPRRRAGLVPNSTMAR